MNGHVLVTILGGNEEMQSHWKVKLSNNSKLLPNGNMHYH